MCRPGIWPPRSKNRLQALLGAFCQSRLGRLSPRFLLAISSTWLWPLTASAQEAEDFENHRSESRPTATTDDATFRMRPAAEWNDAGFSLGTRGKLLLSDETQLASGVRSLWHGNVIFENGYLERTWDDIQKGDLQFRLEVGPHHVFANASSNTIDHTLNGGFRFRTSRKVSLHAYTSATLKDDNSGSRLDSYARFHATYQPVQRWLIQPAIYRVGIGGSRSSDWFGLHLHSRFRRSLVHWIFEPHRSSRLELEQAFDFLHLTWTVGAQSSRYRAYPRRHLWRFGLSQRTWALDLYRGRNHAAQLIEIADVFFGWSRTRTLQQRVFGYRNLSLWFDQEPNGRSGFGFGFVFRGSARRFIRASHGWSSLPAMHQNGLERPHLRFPRFGSRI